MTSKRPQVGSFASISAKTATTVDIAIAFASTGEVGADRVARAVLDEMLGDRLRVIREGLGVSYGVSASVDVDSVMVIGSVEPAYAVDAAKTIAAEIARLRDGDAGLAADFARARRRVLARTLARPLGPQVRAEALERIAIEQRPVAEIDRDVGQVRALDLATLQRLAARELRADRMLAAVRGDESVVEAVLRALGADPAKIEKIEKAE